MCLCANALTVVDCARTRCAEVALPHPPLVPPFPTMLSAPIQIQIDNQHKLDCTSVPVNL